MEFISVGPGRSIQIMKGQISFWSDSRVCVKRNYVRGGTALCRILLLLKK